MCKRKKEKQQTASYEEISDLFLQASTCCCYPKPQSWKKKYSPHNSKESPFLLTTSHLAFYERWPFRYGIHFAFLFHCLTLDKQLNRFLVLILLAFFAAATHPLYNIYFFFSLYATQWQIVNMHVMYSPLRFYYEEREGSCVMDNMPLKG